VSGTSPERHEDDTPVEPRVRDALIGAAFGLVLIYLGTLISYWFLRWLVIGIGALFVVVMSAFTLVVAWQAMSGHILPLVARARGHVRHDPQLGTLTRDVRAQCWAAAVTRGDRTVDFVIQGHDEPSPPLLAHARDLLARFATIEHQVDEYLALEAQDETSDPELAEEIRALRISSVHLREPDRPGYVQLDFKGPDEDRFWTCEYENGTLEGLDFD
jgi:hypothetical protein